MCYLGNISNMNRWLYSVSFLCEYISSLNHYPVELTSYLCYLPYNLIDCVLTLLSVFDGYGKFVHYNLVWCFRVPPFCLFIHNPFFNALFRVFPMMNRAWDVSSMFIQKQTLQK